MLFVSQCRQEGGKNNDGAEKGGEKMVKIYLSRRGGVAAAAAVLQNS